MITKTELTKEIYDFLGNKEMRNMIQDTLYSTNGQRYCDLKEENIPKEIERIYNITRENDFYTSYYCFFLSSIKKENAELEQKFYENRIAMEQVMRYNGFKKHLLMRKLGTYDSTIEEEECIMIICTSEECTKVLEKYDLEPSKYGYEILKTWKFIFHVF